MSKPKDNAAVELWHRAEEATTQRDPEYFRHSDYLFGPPAPPDPPASLPQRRRALTTNRQEILNVLVAQLLQERGLVAAPEQIISRVGLPARRMPDVVVDFQGLRLVIESEYANHRAEDKASKAALRRVEEGIAHLGMALIYPDSLRSAAGDSDTLRGLLTDETLQYAIVTESEAATQLSMPFVSSQKPTIPFIKGTLDQLADSLRRVL